jgi:hypothetical protein
MRRNFERSAARKAVDKGVISREEEWNFLPFNRKWKYRSEVALDLYKQATKRQVTGVTRRRVQPTQSPQSNAVIQPSQDVIDNPPPEERGQSPLRASTEQEIQRLNNELNNLTKFYVRSRKTKLGATAAIEAAKVYMRAERLWARQKKRYDSTIQSGGTLTPRQEQNRVAAAKINEEANALARKIFGPRYKDEVARAMGRDRDLRMKRQRLQGKREALARMAMSLAKLRTGLAKAIVMNLVDNSRKVVAREQYQ